MLDEPTTGLDAVSKQLVFAELLKMVQSERNTVLISSHNLTDLERFADHIGMIKNGQMILEGELSEIVGRFCMVDFHCRLLSEKHGVARPFVLVRCRPEHWRKRN